MMEELIKLGADVNATSDIPDSGPLHVACCYGLKEFFDILVANGASIRDCGPGQRTLLMLAAEGGNVEILEELWKTSVFGLNDKDDHNRTAVWYAVASGRREAFSWFVSRGCDLTIVPAHNQTMMHAAAVGGSVELIDDLVAHGFDVNAVNSDGERPIHAAAFANQTSAICKFVALNVSVNERGERQQTPLHTAAERGMISACDTLIKLGADVNAVDSDGNTPLHLLVEAAVTERVPKEYAVTLAGVFAEHGADIDRVNNEGRSPLLRLMEHGSQEMVTAIALIRKYKTREAAKKAVEEEPPGSDTPLHIRAVLELLMARGFKGPGV
jgi:ankyrin repeat protein